MKKVFTTIIVCLFTASFTYAQCDKKVIIKASKTEYLASDSSVQRSVDEQSEIVFDKTSITIVPGAEERKMTGSISSYTCQFTNPYKDGKMVLKTTMTSAEGDSRGLTITIESKGGKTVFLAAVEGRERVIRLVPDKFEEAN
jgi:hypothetical protein